MLSKININAISVVTLYLTGDRRMDDFYDYVDDQLSDKFSSIQGVGSVRIHGGNELQVHVLIDRERLTAANLTVADIVNKLAANNVKVPAGRVRSGNQEFAIMYDAEFKDFGSLRQLEIGKNQGRRIYLRDVADIQLISKEIRQVGYLNGQPGVAIEIVKKSDANAVKVIQEIRRRYNEIVNSKTLPSGMKLVWFDDSGEFIQASVDDAWNSIIMGILLTALLLFLFLHEPRSTFIACISMPVSVVITFTAMKMLDYTFDLMTLISLGCSTGVLVTNSIVVIENIFKKLSEGKDRKTAAAEGASEVLIAVSASALTNVVVFVPVAMMSSMLGLLFSPFAGVMVISTLVSLFVSFTLTPILASMLFSEKTASAKTQSFFFRLWDRGYDRLCGWFDSSILWTARRSGLVILITLAVSAAICILIVPKVGITFFPDNDRSQFSVKLEFPTDYNLKTTQKRSLEILSEIRKLPFVENTGMTVGYVNALVGKVTEGVYLSEITVKTKPMGKREPIQTLMDRVRTLLSRYDNMSFSISIPKPTGGSDTDIKACVMGPDFSELERFNRIGIKVLEDSGLSKDVDTSVRPGKPQINLLPKRPILQNLGVGAAQLGANVRGSFDGIEVGTYKLSGRSFDIRVKLGEQEGLDTIQGLNSGAIRGQPINLDVLTDRRLDSMSISVIRRDRQRSSWLYANLAPGAALSDAVSTVNTQLGGQLPLGYSLQHSGSAEMMKEGVEDFLEVIIIAIVLTFLLIAAIMESWGRPFLIMFTVPLGFLGMFLALWMAGLPLSMLGFLGGVMMIGIVVNNAILILDECRTLQDKGLGTHAAMIRATQTKFRPIVMTSIASVAGMLPMAFGRGLGYELRETCGLGVVGGLIFSSVLTLYLIPALYFKFVKDTGKKQDAAKV